MTNNSTDAYTEINFNKMLEAYSELKADLEASKAEVEELKGHLARAVKIADEFWDNQKQAVTIYHEELADELEQLKSEIK